MILLHKSIAGIVFRKFMWSDEDCRELCTGADAWHPLGALGTDWNNNSKLYGENAELVEEQDWTAPVVPTIGPVGCGMVHRKLDPS